jgi:hypothetical protein
LIVRYEPGALVSLTLSVVCGVRLTLREKPGTCWLKSSGSATSSSLIQIVAEETRCVPSLSPFTTCST